MMELSLMQRRQDGGEFAEAPCMLRKHPIWFVQAELGLGLVQISVQVVQEKQELAETQKEMSKLQIVVDDSAQKSEGLVREPKHSDLKELHRAVKLCEQALVSVDPAITTLGTMQEIGVQTSQMQMWGDGASSMMWERYDEEVDSLAAVIICGKSLQKRIECCITARTKDCIILLLWI